MRSAVRALTACYDRILEPSGLTVSQYSLLVNLKRLEESSVKDLADCAGLERTTLVRSVKPLVNNGYVEDISKPGARNRRLRVTEAGLKALDAAAPLWREAQMRVRRKIGADGVKLLSDLLTGLEAL
jgi:DNA-binding MarR family transcriptional regulator